MAPGLQPPWHRRTDPPDPVTFARTRWSPQTAPSAGCRKTRGTALTLTTWLGEPGLKHLKEVAADPPADPLGSEVLFRDQVERGWDSGETPKVGRLWKSNDVGVPLSSTKETLEVHYSGRGTLID